MRKKPVSPFYLASAPMFAIGVAFAAIGASGQPAFGYTAVGLLIPSVVLAVAGAWTRRRA